MLYAVADGAQFSDLYTVNPATGAGTLVCSLSGAPYSEMGLMVDPATNVMYATLYDDPSFLYQLNPTTCATVQIGTGMGVPWPHGGDIFGAPAQPAPIPALSGWSMTLFIGLLAMVAVFSLRGYLR
ncbi:MAG: hypothetical protein ACC742_10805 [Thermoanaerobaculales bacterium]